MTLTSPMHVSTVESITYFFGVLKFLVMNVIHVRNCWKNHLHIIHSKGMNDILMNELHSF